MEVAAAAAAPCETGQTGGGAKTGRRSSLAAAKALDARLNEAEPEPEPEPDSEPVMVVQPASASASAPEPEPEPEPELGSQLRANMPGLLSSLVSGGTESSPATPPSDAGGAGVDEALGGSAAATSLAAVAGGLDVAVKTAAAATKLKKRARKKKPKNVVSRLYQKPKRAPSAAGAVAASNSRGSLAAAKLSKAGGSASGGGGAGPQAAAPAGGAAALLAGGGGKGKLAALINKNVLPAVEKTTMKKGGMASVVKKAQKKYTGADTCKDLRGKRYDIKEFREKRNKAVLKGMKYMKKFLLKDNCKALYEIGDDAPSIFFEIWYTSANSDIRVRGKETARVLLEKLVAHQLEKVTGDFEKVPDHDDFFGYIFLIRCMHEMEMPYDAMLAKADEAFKKNGWHDTNELFGVHVDNLDKVPTSEWLILLMHVLMMEYMNVICLPRRWRMRWGLKECLLALKKHPLASSASGDDSAYHEAFYVATHIGYAISAYNSVQAPIQRMVPWLDKYIRHSFRDTMAKWRKKDKGEQVYVDIDGIGEMVDTFRGMGLTEVSKNGLFEPFIYKNEHFTKTGSGQT